MSRCKKFCRPRSRRLKKMAGQLKGLSELKRSIADDAENSPEHPERFLHAKSFLCDDRSISGLNNDEGHSNNDG